MKLNDYTKCGRCSNCGECCSDILHLDEEEIHKIDEYLKTHKVVQHNKGANNLKCPFRNDIFKKCDIYEARPLICQRFKCDVQPEEAFEMREVVNFHKKPRSLSQIFFNDDSKSKLLKKQFGIKVYKRGEK